VSQAGSSSAEDDARDQRLIGDVLSGDVTERTHPWVFDEDVLLFAVRRIEAADPGWLLVQLGHREVTFERRVAVFAQTRLMRGHALALLQAERPDFLSDL
jgi:hypothetical protein